MGSETEVMDMELICVIVNFGMGSKLLKVCKKHGIGGGTITLARGTANNHLLDYLGLSEIRKEVVYMVADKETAYRVLDIVHFEFKLDKPNRGIAFTMPICATVGMKRTKNDHKYIERGEDTTMYQVITIIVDKGKAEDVIEAAISAGSKGGTIINGRGSGIYETSKLFAMDIEPEKEIVIILSEIDRVDQIVSVIRTKLQIDEPKKGIIYVQDVNKTYGVFK